MRDSFPIYMNAAGHGLPNKACANAIAEQALRPDDGLENEAALRDRARTDCAALLSVESHQIGLGAGTFQCWRAAMERLPVGPGRILLAAHEWGDHLRWLQRLSDRTGITLDVLAGDEDEVLDPQAWAARIDTDLRAICLPLVTSVAGLRYPVEAIAAQPRPDDTLLVIDAAQALGRMPVSPRTLGCDVLAGTARKWLRGPRQTAMMFLSERAERVLGCSAQDLEPRDLNGALLAGLAQAVRDYIADGSQIIDRIAALDRGLRHGLADHGLLPGSVSGTVTCALPAASQPQIAARLAQRGIMAKWCLSGQEEPRAPHAPLSALLRVSPHVYNSADDIAAFIDAVASA